MNCRRTSLCVSGFAWLALASLACGQAPSPSASAAPAATINATGMAPAAILPGGKVLLLFPPDSPALKRERVSEPEKYVMMPEGVAPRISTAINIHQPSIEVHVPGGRTNTGAAVILIAGGGHNVLMVASNAGEYVPFFQNLGVTTIILRNRLRIDGYDVAADAVTDALQAMRVVRAHAVEWKIDPARIGLIGFSAGAELAAPAALFFSEFERQHAVPDDPLSQVSARPDFVGLIYPGPTPFAKNGAPKIPANVPPSFLACAGSGDRVHALWATEYFTAMLTASVPNVEMHIYGNGAHKGWKYHENLPFGTWQDRFVDWFKDLGFLAAPGIETKAARDVAEYALKHAS